MLREGDWLCVFRSNPRKVSRATVRKLHSERRIRPKQFSLGLCTGQRLWSAADLKGKPWQVQPAFVKIIVKNTDKSNEYRFLHDLLQRTAPCQYKFYLPRANLYQMPSA